MTIKVYADRIEIGAKTITTTPTGIRIGDSLAANTQAQGYARQANFTARELAFGNDRFQGSSFGYTSGGYSGPPPAYRNTIDKFPFATNSNATDVGDLTQAREGPTGQSSTVSGYTSGGDLGAPGVSNVVDKFLFATDSNATDVGDLTQARANPAGQSSTTHGYASGGLTVPGPSFTASNTIDKFPFAADINATDVGDLSQTRRSAAGQSSATHGYTSGGIIPPAPHPAVNTIDKFPFTSDTNANDVGDLTQARRDPGGQSSTTHGYSSGGGSNLNTIDKFPFATDTNATDVGDLSQGRYFVAAQSSTASGYSSGGLSNPPVTRLNTIDKFPFATDTNASDVGDLSQIRQGAAGQQF